MKKCIYQEHYSELKETKLQPVLAYFHANWHNIRKEWVQGLKGRSKNLLNSTNNRVESINQKLKMVITKYTGIVQFVGKYFYYVIKLFGKKKGAT